MKGWMEERIGGINKESEKEGWNKKSKVTLKDRKVVEVKFKNHTSQIYKPQSFNKCPLFSIT